MGLRLRALGSERTGQRKRINVQNSSRDKEVKSLAVELDTTLHELLVEPAAPA